jgi:hypothetical protein
MRRTRDRIETMDEATERLVEITARIESGELPAAPSNADLLRSLVKA